jgi:hypothetical protein
MMSLDFIKKSQLRFLNVLNLCWLTSCSLPNVGLIYQKHSLYILLKKVWCHYCQMLLAQKDINVMSLGDISVTHKTLKNDTSVNFERVVMFLGLSKMPNLYYLKTHP